MWQVTAVKRRAALAYAGFTGKLDEWPDEHGNPKQLLLVVPGL